MATPRQFCKALTGQRTRSGVTGTRPILALRREGILYSLN